MSEADLDVGIFDSVVVEMEADTLYHSWDKPD
jgi:hypothetical protein